MVRHFLLTLLLVLIAVSVFSQKTTQPESGPGGSDYLHEDVLFQDFAQEADGYWLFEPQNPTPKSANIVVFLHGYGAYNPMVYGEWIRHIVRKGNIVIFPRYQENMFFPLPSDFATNSAKAIKDALKELKKKGHVQPIIDNLALVGHSFGGAISANLAVNYKDFGIPKPAVAQLCSPGTGWVSMGRLDSYEKMPEDLKLLVVVSEDDNIVGDEFGWKVFKDAVHTKDKNFIRQFRDRHNQGRFSAHHNETYSLRKEYDSGHRSPSTARAYRISKINNMDYFGYWKWFDALLECSKKGHYCEIALGDTEEQRYLGCWEDGTPIKEVEVFTEAKAIEKGK